MTYRRLLEIAFAGDGMLRIACLAAGEAADGDDHLVFTSDPGLFMFRILPKMFEEMGRGRVFCWPSGRDTDGMHRPPQRVRAWSRAELSRTKSFGSSSLGLHVKRRLELTALRLLILHLCDRIQGGRKKRYRQWRARKTEQRPTLAKSARRVLLKNWRKAARKRRSTTRLMHLPR